LPSCASASRKSSRQSQIVPGVERQPLKKLAINERALLNLLNRWRAEAEKQGHRITRIGVAFEAGHDGFWLARWLAAQGVEAHVIHASSVAVTREHRRSKTDRLDTELLKRGFLGWLRGERGHCKMVAVPTLAEEDAKPPSRERETLVGEASRLITRVKLAFVRLGIRGFNPRLRAVATRLETLRTPEGEPIPPNTLAALKRDLERHQIVKKQIRELEQTRLESLAQAPAKTPNVAGACDRHRGRNGRHVGAGSTVTDHAGSARHSALCRSDRLARRKFGAKRRDKGSARSAMRACGTA
jgi:transposase